MPRLAGEIILADHLNFGEEGIAAAAVTSGSDTTTSATYVNLAGTGSVTSFNFTKYSTTTRVRVDVAATYFTSSTASGARFGVRIDGVDYNVAQLREVTAAANAHLTAAGFIYIAASVIAAGTYTVQGRWLRTAGAGTLSRNGDDWLAISVRECV